MLSFLYIKDKTQGTYKWGKSKWTFAGEVRQIAASVKASSMPLPQVCLSWKKKKTKRILWCMCGHATTCYIYIIVSLLKKKKILSNFSNALQLHVKIWEFNLHLGTHWTPLSLEWTTRVTETHENFYSWSTRDIYLNKDVSLKYICIYI